MDCCYNKNSSSLRVGESYNQEWRVKSNESNFLVEQCKFEFKVFIHLDRLSNQKQI